MRRLRAPVLGLLGVVLLGVLWEAYKAVMPDQGLVVHGIVVLPRNDDSVMPHLWTIAQRLVEPVNNARYALNLWEAVVGAMWFSLKIVALGWGVGVVVGLLVATLMQRFRTAHSALLPWVVLSQTVPLIALAPLVTSWGSQLSLGGIPWDERWSVALIAAYLAFFPVSIGALRGFSSPDTAHLDLMRSYAVGWWRTFLTLRVPASVPYLLPALRLAAANAVVGTVVAEVSIGLRGGVGRMIVEFGAIGSADPAKQWAPILGAVLIGLVAAGLVTLLGTTLRRYRRAEVDA